MFRLYKSFFLFLKLSGVVLLSSFLFSCEDEPDLGAPPTTDFEVNAKVAEIGELLSFTNNSTTSDGGTLTYEWDFGDGAFDTRANPTHFYSDTGSYTVTLTATTELGANEIFTEDILIGRRYLKSLELLVWSDSSFIVDENDSIVFVPWDDDLSAPDIAWVVLGPEGIGDIDTRTNPVENVTSSFTLDVEDDYLLTSDYYVVAIGDVDDFSNPDSIVVDWLVVRSGNNPIIPTNPNLTYHFDDATGEYTLGKDPETGEGSVLIGNDPNYYDLAIGFLNFEIK